MEIQAFQYRELRERLEEMKRGDTLVMDRRDPLLASLAQVLYPLFEEEVLLDDVVELHRYHPADSFFIVTLLKHLESF